MGLRSFLESFKVERSRDGVFSYWKEEEAFTSDSDFLKTSLDNYVVMSLIALRAKIYSQMKIQHLNSAGAEVENSPYLKLLRQPNFFQSGEDFLFQEMWFKSATGTNLTYQVKIYNEPESLWNLVPSEIDFKKTSGVSKFISSKKDFKEYGNRELIYKLDEQDWRLKLSDIIPSYDLANGLVANSFMRSPSRLQGLSKSIQNIDEALKAKNINLKMSQKYLVSSADDGNSAQIQPDDRADITRKIGAKSVLISNSRLDAKHLVSDMKKLFLDEQANQDALKCLLAFGMNREVLNYFADGGATYENQEKSMQNYIQNDIQPSANDRMSSLSSQWGLTEKGEKLIASYDHLPVMSSIIKDKIATLKTFEETLKISLENGTVDINEAKEMSFKLKEKLNL